MPAAEPTQIVSTTIDVFKMIIWTLGMVFTFIAAVSTTKGAMFTAKIANRSKAVELYKEDVVALERRCVQLEDKVKTLEDALETGRAEGKLALNRAKAEREKMSAEINQLRAQTDYTALEAHMEALAEVVRTASENNLRMLSAITTLTEAIAGMRAQCASTQANLLEVVKQ